MLLIDANAEDEQLFREQRALVRDQPVRLEVVHCLAEAMARLRPDAGEPVDVILLDLHLPDSVVSTASPMCRTSRSAARS